jgi:glycosyltransferase involved in cell wall biosynthesis
VEQRNKIANLFRDSQSEVLFVDGIAATQFIPEGLPAVIDLCDSMSLYYKRQSTLVNSIRERIDFKLEARAYTWWERKISRQYRHIVFIGDKDRAQFTQNTGSSAHIIPNGVDLAYYSCSESTKAPLPILLFVGVLNYPPNVDAVVNFAKRIWPTIHRLIPESKFQIVGKDPDEMVRSLANDPGISLAANVPDTRPYLDHATVFVCPLRFGAGLKNKILSAMAMKLPVVATPLAMEGIGARHQKECLIAEEIEFAECVTSLLSNHQYRLELAEAAHRYVTQEHSWEKSGGQLEALLESARL